jgi:regulatory protein
VRRPRRDARGPSPPPPEDVHHAALRLLRARELTERQLRDRLASRGFAADAISDAVTRLAGSGALDDGRAAAAFARTSVRVRRRGRDRVLRELEAMGVARDVARRAVENAFADADEPRMIADAIARRRRTRGRLPDGEFRRLRAYLIRQGFAPAAVLDALRKAGGSAADED